MEKLWSPWRSEYIESFKNKEKKKECIFCSAAGEEVGKPDNLLVAKGKYTFMVLNLYPYNNGHLMIVPYTHTDSFSDLSGEEKSEIMDKLQLAEQALRKVMSPEGFNIGANVGKISGAGIDDHIHFHIVPRWNGDTNFMPVLGDVKVISQDLMVTKQNLIKAIDELSG